MADLEHLSTLVLADNQAMSDTGPDETDVNRLFEQGLALVNNGEAERAKVIFDRVLALEPCHSKALCGRGTAHRLLGQHDEALQYYDAALAVAPDYARAIFNRGLTLLAKDSSDDAFAEMGRAIAVDPDAGFYLIRGQCYRSLKRKDEALQDFTTYMGMDAAPPAEAFCERGSLLVELGRAGEAEADLLEAVRLSPNTPVCYMWLAYTHSTREHYDRAVAVFDQAIANCGNSADLLFRRGCALYSDDDHEAAIRDFDKAIGLDPNSAEVWYWRGRAAERLDDYGAAIADFNAAIDQTPDYADALAARGEAYLDIGEPQQAIADLSQAIEHDSKTARHFRLRGQAWLREGDDTCAMADFDAALRLEPDNKSALEARGQLLVEQGEFGRAEADLDTLDQILMETEVSDMTQRRARISLLLAEHFDSLPLADLTITERRFPFRVRADLQRAVDRLFDGSTQVKHFCGVKKEYSYEGTTFSDLLFPTSRGPALGVPPEYEELDVGEPEPARCLKNALWLLANENLKFAVLLTPVKEHGSTIGIQFQVAVPQGAAGGEIAQRFFKHVEETVAKAESYRGKILSLEVSDRYSGLSSGIQVHKLRTVERDQVILPKATLELLDRNIVQFARQRVRLGKLGLSTKKGLLFYGPPGTGKTHTIHYLAGAMEGHTTLLIAAEQVGLLGEYMTLARLLQPSIVVIEDADLIARERTEMESVCEEVLLNKLLNEMDGLRPDTDVFFILTTNRPQALEAALASRPGRIDQAIEFPLPDADGRAKLIRLYCKGMVISDEVVAATVRRTERVSAAFIKELMRRAAQFQLERDGEGALSEADIGAALEELLFAGGSLNCSLLGIQRDGN
jgi:tetratricopeptide (TPR) repeat protein